MKKATSVTITWAKMLTIKSCLFSLWISLTQMMILGKKKRMTHTMWMILNKAFHLIEGMNSSLPYDK